MSKYLVGYLYLACAISHAVCHRSFCAYKIVWSPWVQSSIAVCFYGIRPLGILTLLRAWLGGASPFSPIASAGYRSYYACSFISPGVCIICSSVGFSGRPSLPCVDCCWFCRFSRSSFALSRVDVQSRFRLVSPSASRWLSASFPCACFGARGL